MPRRPGGRPRATEPRPVQLDLGPCFLRPAAASRRGGRSGWDPRLPAAAGGGARRDAMVQVSVRPAHGSGCEDAIWTSGGTSWLCLADHLAGGCRCWVSRTLPSGRSCIAPHSAISPGTKWSTPCLTTVTRRPRSGSPSPRRPCGSADGSFDPRSRRATSPLNESRASSSPRPARSDRQRCRRSVDSGQWPQWESLRSDEQAPQAAVRADDRPGRGSRSRTREPP